MVRRRFTAGVLALALSLAAVPAHAALVTFTDATWGGTGIPNTRVMLVQDNDVTLALTAHARCQTIIPDPQVCGPALTDDNIDTFFAQAGTPFANKPGTTEDESTYAGWNFGVYLRSTNTFPVFGQLLVDGPNGLSYDSGLFPIGDPAGQNSFNIAMPFIGGDALATGLYTITLRAVREQSTNDRQVPLGTASINVRVVPEPTAFALVGLGLVLVARRRRRA